MKKGKITVLIVVALLIGGGAGFGITNLVTGNKSDNQAVVTPVVTNSDSVVTETDSDNNSDGSIKVESSLVVKTIKKLDANGNITVQISVKGDSGKVPSGEITIAHDGIKTVGALTNGTVTLTFHTRAADEFTAQYSGDSAYYPSSKSFTE
jgi:hypothetical protein